MKNSYAIVREQREEERFENMQGKEKTWNDYFYWDGCRFHYNEQRMAIYDTNLTNEELLRGKARIISKIIGNDYYIEFNDIIKFDFEVLN